MWCICCPHSDSVLVEQPDTIFDDYVHAEDVGGIEVHNLRTTDFGVEADNFVRSVSRGLIIDWPAENDHRRAKQQPTRSQYMYANPDERDRSRSTWINYPHMCQILARARSRSHQPTSHLPYADAIEIFAQRWHIKPAIRYPLVTDRVINS